MITAKKLSIYRKYDGDVDGWARVGSRREKKVMSDQDWYEIDELLRRLHLVEKGLASEEFESQTREMLEERTENAEVARLLRKRA